MAYFRVCIVLWVFATAAVAQPNGPWVPYPTGEACDHLDGQFHDALNWNGLAGTRSLTVLRGVPTSKQIQFGLPRIQAGAADSLLVLYRSLTEDLVFRLGPPDSTTERPFTEVPLNNPEPYDFCLATMYWKAGPYRSVQVEFRALQAVNSRQLVVRLSDTSTRLPRTQPGGR
jgi:hypothetical protein